MKIAAGAYTPEWHADWDGLADKLDRWIRAAVAQGADLAVFPEYAGIEAALIGAPLACPGALVWRDRMAAAAGRWHDLHASLAQRHGIWVLAGSMCAADGDGFVNRAVLVGPNGQMGAQDKVIPTPYEREEMGLQSGDAIQLFDTQLGRIGVLICYDCEFPMLARQLVEAGADLILVPSCTDLPAGQTRVRQSARARAIEGQCLVVQAPLVGRVAGCDVVDVSCGQTGFFAPPDHGLPPSGVLAQGKSDQAGWTVLEVDPAQIAAPRQSGQVGNAAHWPEQARITMAVLRRL